jgi:hypothetical protein
MSSNLTVIVHQLKQDFQELIEFVTHAESKTRTAYEVELKLFRSLLTLGAELLRLFFVQRAAERPEAPVYQPDGTSLSYHSLRRTTYVSVFGKIQFQRHYFYAAEKEGVCPLDAELSLPPRCYSDLLRDWAEYCTTTESYGESNQILKRILDLSISKLALETGVQEDAVDVETFYEHKPVPPPQEEDAILVVQADGKGVPMVRKETAPRVARRGKGKKRTKKKEAVVTASYTIAPYSRTPEQVVERLMREKEEHEEGPEGSENDASRPVPVGKEVRATLDGKDSAFEQLVARVTQRDGAHIEQRVALTDGDDALQRQMEGRLSTFTLVLDIIHASEYLWAAANAVLGEQHPERNVWVRDRLLLILSDETEAVIQDLEATLETSSLSDSQRDTLSTTIGYYRRNLPYMRYGSYLADGWPIGTGVVEGACGHLVKDRMEHSGMRWTRAGAQAMLDLRAVRINDDWDTYQTFHRQCQHQRLYDRPLGAIPVPELFTHDYTVPEAA